MRNVTQSPSRSNESGVVIGLLLFAPVVLVQAYWLIGGYSEVTPLQEGLWALYVALLLVVSYAVPWKSRVFRGVLWVFKNLHIPRGDGVALIYAFIFALIGVYMIAARSDSWPF